jgi:DNA-binding XRE family transcriptional regulator
LTVIELDSARLVAALNRKALTQGDLAQRSGVSRDTIGRMVRGLPVTRLTATRVIRVLVEIPDVPGMSDFLPDHE